MLPWLKLSEKGFMVMAFYIVHYTRWWRGAERETLSICLHNIVKIFSSRLDSTRLDSFSRFIVIAVGLRPRALWVISSACVYLSVICSYDPLSVYLSVCASHNCFHRVIQLPNCLHLACSEQRTKVNASFFYLMLFSFFFLFCLFVFFVGSSFFVPLITATWPVHFN